MADKKDEIINLQLDIIRKMTENNIRRLSDDIWGPSRKPSQPAGTTTKTETPAKPVTPTAPPPVTPKNPTRISSKHPMVRT